MSCKQKLLDVFITKDSSNYRGEFDDEFLGPVWSVEILQDGTAAVVNKSSAWVTWCKGITSPDLNVGDQVRIGNTATDFFTDVCTVLQKLQITRICNAVSHDGITSNVGLLQPNGTTLTLTKADPPDPPGDDQMATTTLPYGTAVTLPQNPWYAYRLNLNTNVTDIRGAIPYEITHLQNAIQNTALFNRRHQFRHSHGSASSDEQLYYPLYKVKRWLPGSGELSVNLDYGVRRINTVTLIGYSVFAKRTSGFQNTHEAFDDDWVALHIKGMTGDVVSNNEFANGSFAVLHMNGPVNTSSGAVEQHVHDSQGLFKLNIDGASMRELHLKFVDRNGDPAHFGRIHLWFKLGVVYG